MRSLVLLGAVVFVVISQAIAGEIVSVDPNEASEGENLWVTITGDATMFGQGSGTVVSFGQGSSTIFTPTSIIVNSPLEIEAYCEIPSSASTGDCDVRVTEIGITTWTLVNGFRILDVPSSCGDVDGSGLVDIDDIVYLISYIFGGGPPPVPLESGDVDCTFAIDVDDVVYLIQYVFAGGYSPCDPWDIGMTSCIPTSAEDAEPTRLPTEFALSQNFPNPFNAETTMEFSLERSERIRIDVFDILGRRIRKLVDERMSPGVNAIVWDGRDDDGRTVASGTYFYRLAAGSFVETKKMVMIK